MSPANLAHRVVRAQDRLFDRLRDHRAASAASRYGTVDTFDALRDAQYALVVTFRSSGEAVPTPMWFGFEGERVYVRSLAHD